MLGTGPPHNTSPAVGIFCPTACPPPHIFQTVAPLFAPRSLPSRWEAIAGALRFHQATVRARAGCPARQGRHVKPNAGPPPLLERGSNPPGQEDSGPTPPAQSIRAPRAPPHSRVGAELVRQSPRESLAPCAPVPGARMGGCTHARPGLRLWQWESNRTARVFVRAPAHAT